MTGVWHPTTRSPPLCTLPPRATPRGPFFRSTPRSRRSSAIRERLQMRGRMCDPGSRTSSLLPCSPTACKPAPSTLDLPPSPPRPRVVRRPGRACTAPATTLRCTEPHWEGDRLLASHLPAPACCVAPRWSERGASARKSASDPASPSLGRRLSRSCTTLRAVHASRSPSESLVCGADTRPFYFT